MTDHIKTAERVVADLNDPALIESLRLTNADLWKALDAHLVTNRRLRTDLARLRLSVDPDVLEDAANAIESEWNQCARSETLRSLAVRQRHAIAEMEKPIV